MLHMENMEVLEQFVTVSNYLQFIENRIDFGRRKKKSFVKKIINQLHRVHFILDSPQNSEAPNEQILLWVSEPGVVR